MFSIYGISGPIYYGSLENMGRLPPVAGAASAKGARSLRSDESRTNEADFITPFGQAAKAYQSMLPDTLDRGPLYHANQIMQPEVITVNADDEVEKALQVLVSNQIHQAPVLDEKAHLTGIVSDRDLLRALYTGNSQIDETLHQRVADVMTTPVVAATAQTDIRRIARAMLDHGVEGVPIVNESGHLVGFISRTDILGAVVTDPPLSTWR